MERGRNFDQKATIADETGRKEERKKGRGSLIRVTMIELECE